MGNPVRLHPKKQLMIYRVEKLTNVGLENPANTLSHHPFMQRCQRLVWVAPRPEAIGEPKKIDLVDSTKNLGHCALNDFVFQRRHTERSLATVRFGNINSAHRQRPVAPGMDPLTEILQTILQVLLVGPHRFPIDSRTRAPLLSAE